MAKILGVAAHDGNALVVVSVLYELQSRGVDVAIALQEGESAAIHYNHGGSLADQLREVPVFIHTASDEFEEFVARFDAVVVGMSPVSRNNLEVTAMLAAGERDIPSYGIEEVIGGRGNLGWRDYVSRLTRLFAPLPAEDFSACPESVVGSPALDRWRGVSVADLNASARAKLGIGDEPVIYFFPPPEQESPLALNLLVYVLAKIVDQFDWNHISRPVFILNRHRRELQASFKTDNGGGYRYGLRYMSEGLHLKVFDNSPEFDHLSPGDDRSIVPEFRPSTFLSYQEMLAVTAHTGLAITFFGTDGLMVAPFLADQGVLSVLWLDPVLGGRVLETEKQLETFRLPQMIEVLGGAEPLVDIFDEYIIQKGREELQRALSSQYPFPEKSATKLIVEQIMDDLTA